MLYQLAGFGTLHFVVPKIMNWILNIVFFGLIVASYVANRDGRVPLGKAPGQDPGEHSRDYRLLRSTKAEANAGGL